MNEQKSKNNNLHNAKTGKNDEFYTQFHDIEKEINAYLDYDPNIFFGKTIFLPCDDPEWSNFTKFFAQNFQRLGLKKLVSTSFAPESKNYKINYSPTLFETQNPQFDEKKTVINGKIFTLTHDKSGDGRIDVNDLEWTYLKGDGDFKSEEILKLRDEADIIITNPPFSLFREFVSWIMEAEKKFVIIGNMNAITYKEVFRLIKENKIWLGVSNGAKEYVTPDGTMQKMGNTCWFTNLEHGRRHAPLRLMTMQDNIKYSKHKEIKGKEYQQYDNYNALEIPFTDAIPSDYEGIMAVPISFLEKYSPEQFEILGITQRNDDPFKIKKYAVSEYKNANDLNARGVIIIDGKPKPMYARVLIKLTNLTK